VDYTKGYKYRIYRRFVYDRFLEIRSEAWEIEKKSISYNKTSSMLTDLKKNPDLVWLKSVDSMALQESLKDLDRAFQNFFKKRAHYPSKKFKRNPYQSYRTRNQSKSIRVEGNRIRLPKVGMVKIKFSRDIEGKVLNATISRNATGKYFVSLIATFEMEPSQNMGGKIGIDIGIT